MLKTHRLGAVLVTLALIVSPITGAVAANASTVTGAGGSTAATGAWLSGASGNGVPDGQFAAWRSRSVDIAGTWSDNNLNAANFWQLQKGFDYYGWTKPIDIAVGAIDAGESWKTAATGAYDARWTASLKKLASLRVGSGTTYIRFAHEMNGNWYPWSVNTTNYVAFDTAWKRYRALQKQYFPTAKLVFSVNRESTGAGMDWRKFFPGKQYVDLLSVDYYNQWPYVGTAADWNASVSALDMYGAPKGLAQHLAFAKSQGLPLAISEWSGNDSFGDSPVFISSFLKFVQDHAGSGSGQIAYEILFNVGNYSTNYALYGKGASMPRSSAAYKAFFANQASSSTAKATLASKQAQAAAKAAADAKAKVVAASRTLTTAEAHGDAAARASVKAAAIATKAAAKARVAAERHLPAEQRRKLNAASAKARAAAATASKTSAAARAAVAADKKTLTALKGAATAASAKAAASQRTASRLSAAAKQPL